MCKTTQKVQLSRQTRSRDRTQPQRLRLCIALTGFANFVHALYHCYGLNPTPSPDRDRRRAQIPASTTIALDIGAIVFDAENGDSGYPRSREPIYHLESVLACPQTLYFGAAHPLPENELPVLICRDPSSRDLSAARKLSSISSSSRRFPSKSTAHYHLLASRGVELTHNRLISAPPRLRPPRCAPLSITAPPGASAY